jgi:hypothetical protein
MNSGTQRSELAFEWPFAGRAMRALQAEGCIELTNRAPSFEYGQAGVWWARDTSSADTFGARPPAAINHPVSQRANANSPAHTPPRRYSVRVDNGEGVAVANVSLVAPLAAGGRFQGFTSDDVIYCLMPGRFANGETANDDPPSLAEMHDRGQAPLL